MSTTAPTAVEDAANCRPSPIGTLQRHYRLAAPLRHNGVDHTSVVVVTGPRSGEALVYAGRDDGLIADYDGIARVDSGGDAGALAALGYRWVEPEMEPA